MYDVMFVVHLIICVDLFHVLRLRLTGRAYQIVRPLKIRIYFNIVDLCGILPYKRMYPYKCGIKINYDILTSQKDQ